MWNEPTPEQLRRLPPLGTNGQNAWRDIAIYEHFFLSACDWYLAEYDRNDRLFFGYAILNGDLDNAEWGYVDFDEIRSVNVHGFQIDRDLHWTVRPAGQVERIVEAYRHQGLG